MSRLILFFTIFVGISYRFFSFYFGIPVFHYLISLVFLFKRKIIFLSTEFINLDFRFLLLILVATFYFLFTIFLTEIPLNQIIYAYIYEISIFISYFFGKNIHPKIADKILPYTLFIVLISAILTILQNFNLFGSLYDFNLSSTKSASQATYRDTFNNIRFRSDGLSGNWHSAGLIFCLFLISIFTSKNKLNFFDAAMLITLLVALLATQSRASMFLLIILFAYNFFRFLFKLNLKLKIKKFFLFVIMIFLFLIIILYDPANIFIQIFDKNVDFGNIENRLATLINSFSFFFNSEIHNLFFGYGLGSTGPAVVSGIQILPRDINVVDVIFIMEIYQYGLFGLIIKLILLLSIYQMSKKLFIQKANLFNFNFVNFFFIAFFISYFLGSMAYDRTITFIVFLLIGSYTNPNYANIKNY